MSGLSPRLREIVGTVAPSLAKALGGPLAGIAVRAIAERVLGSPDAEIAAIEQRLERASSGDLRMLREVDETFETDMRELGVELDRIAAEDRADARGRQIATGDWTPAVLAAVILMGFFTLIAALMFLSVPQGSDEIVYIMVGVLGGMSTQVANFFFGSSSGSKAKTDVIARMQGVTPVHGVPHGFTSGGLY